MLRDIKTNQRLERRYTVSIDDSPAIIAGGEHVTLTDNGGNNYTLTLATAAARPINALVTEDGSAGAYIDNRTTSSVDVQLTGAVACCVEIIAWDSADDT